MSHLPRDWQSPIRKLVDAGRQGRKRASERQQARRDELAKQGALNFNERIPRILYDTCPGCGGRGCLACENEGVIGREYVECDNCRGKGKVAASDLITLKRCPACKGRGEIPREG